MKEVHRSFFCSLPIELHIESVQMLTRDIGKFHMSDIFIDPFQELLISVNGPVFVITLLKFHDIIAILFESFLLQGNGSGSAVDFKMCSHTFQFLLDLCR